MPGEPTITCPKCRAEIKLTESLAAPLVESTRLNFEKQLAQKDSDIANREQVIKDRDAALKREKESVEQVVKDREASLDKERNVLTQQFAERLNEERTKIAADEAKKARLALSNDLDQKTNELADLQEVLKQRDEKLAEAQKAQAELIRKQRELDDAKREMDLTIERRVQDSIDVIRASRRSSDAANCFRHCGYTTRVD